MTDADKKMRADELRKKARANELRAKATNSPTAANSDRGFLTSADAALQGFGEGLLASTRATVQGLGESVSLGVLPKMQAATSYITRPFTGESFSEREQQFRDIKKQAPIAAGAGEALGFVAPGIGAEKAIQSAYGAAKTIPGKLTQLAGEGALLGSAYTPEGKDSIEGRIKSGAKGAAIAGGVGAVTKGLGRATEFAGDALKDGGMGMRLRGAGAMTKEFKALEGKAAINKINNFIKKEKLLSPGDTVEKVVKKSQKIVDSEGSKLKSLYDEAKAKIDDPKFVEKLSPLQQDKYLTARFAPGSQKDEILSKIASAKDLKYDSNAQNALNKVSSYLDDIVSKHGDDLDIIQAREIKSAIDNEINYMKQSQDLPANQKAMLELRRHISEKIDDQAKFLDSVLGGTRGKQLKEVNQRFGNAKTVLDMAKNKTARERSNRLMGLSEQIGTGVGAIAGPMISGSPYGVLAGGAGLLGAHAGRRYGAGVAAPLMEGAGGLLQGSKGLISPLYRPAVGYGVSK